jgi:hypothetical protein
MMDALPYGWMWRQCAHPTFRTPASICFTEPNDMFAPGLIVIASAGFTLLDCAFAEPIMTSSADSKGHDRSAQRAAAIMVGFFGHIFLSNWMQIDVAACGMEIRAHFAPVLQPFPISAVIRTPPSDDLLDVVPIGELAIIPLGPHSWRTLLS